MELHKIFIQILALQLRNSWGLQKGFDPIVAGLKLCCCQLNIEETLIASQLGESLFEVSCDFYTFLSISRISPQYLI